MSDSKNNSIVIRGARTHNLKGVDLDIPKMLLVVITGVSGSGKSSLAFDTIYAEGQRRYVESLSNYARQFLSQMAKPDVDFIEGLSPAISIEQKSISHNPRSTVGTVTEIYDYVRLLYARIGIPMCPIHKLSLHSKSVSQIVDYILGMPHDTIVSIIAPIATHDKEYSELIDQIRQTGFNKLRINGTVYDIEMLPSLVNDTSCSIDLVIDRLKNSQDLRGRVADSVETALMYGNHKVVICVDGQDTVISSQYACDICDYTVKDLEPRMFSFNSPHGACAACNGIGTTLVIDPDKIVQYPELSLLDGAIPLLMVHREYLGKITKILKQQFAVKSSVPWQELSNEIRQMLLHGNSSFKINGIIAIIENLFCGAENYFLREEISRYYVNQACSACGGTRLNDVARNVLIDGVALDAVTGWKLVDVHKFFSKLQLENNRKTIADRIITELCSRLSFLLDVGLDYITLDRSTSSLSGGEGQRIRLASQIGSGLTGVLYVLDEPSIGLHQKDNERLIRTLHHLRDIGNTVIVVEHDFDTICSADHVVDIGPMAGVHGGRVVAQGKFKDIIKSKESITGQYLSGKKNTYIPEHQRSQNKGFLTLSGANLHNLKNVELKLPIGNFVCVTGVSGSGKSTLINETLYPAMHSMLNYRNNASNRFSSIENYEVFDKVVNIDQSPIGRTPRSNIATYSGIFTEVRKLFEQTTLARERRYKSNRFSFNVRGGRCEHCAGDGIIRVEMHFLPDMYVTCDVCNGMRYGRETLEVLYRGKNISDVLNLTVEAAADFFTHIPKIKQPLDILVDVGLGYITLGQSAITLSGGEAQRIKLAFELSKKQTKNTLYILDEPTTGLHFYDIDLLLIMLHRLVDYGNTVVVIEHNMDVIRTADWIIDLGPNGGDNGGTIVIAGTVDTVMQHPHSHTGVYLKQYVKRFD